MDKALELNQVSARVGDNIEIKCDVTGSPTPPIVWRRHGLDLAQLAEEELKVFPDGALYINNVRLIHAGNYTCHAQRNKDVVQTHVLHVHSTFNLFPRLVLLDSLLHPTLWFTEAKIIFGQLFLSHFRSDDPKGQRRTSQPTSVGLLLSLFLSAHIVRWSVAELRY